jgi:hypothetical protein
MAGHRVTGPRYFDQLHLVGDWSRRLKPCRPPQSRDITAQDTVEDLGRARNHEPSLDGKHGHALFFKPTLGMPRVTDGSELHKSFHIFTSYRIPECGRVATPPAVGVQNHGRHAPYDDRLDALHVHPADPAELLPGNSARTDDTSVFSWAEDEKCILESPT